MSAHVFDRGLSGSSGRGREQLRDFCLEATHGRVHLCACRAGAGLREVMSAVGNLRWVNFFKACSTCVGLDPNHKNNNDSTTTNYCNRIGGVVCACICVGAEVLWL